MHCIIQTFITFQINYPTIQSFDHPQQSLEAKD